MALTGKLCCLFGPGLGWCGRCSKHPHWWFPGRDRTCSVWTAASLALLQLLASGHPDNIACMWKTQKEETETWSKEGGDLYLTLPPEKATLFQEAFRVKKSGSQGREAHARPCWPDRPRQSLTWWMLQPARPMPGIKIKGVHLYFFSTWLSGLQGCPGRRSETSHPAHNRQLESRRDKKPTYSTNIQVCVCWKTHSFWDYTFSLTLSCCWLAFLRKSLSRWGGAAGMGVGDGGGPGRGRGWL